MTTSFIGGEEGLLGGTPTIKNAVSPEQGGQFNIGEADMMAAIKARGWPRMAWARPGLPTVYLYPKGAPHPGPEYMRVLAIKEMGLNGDTQSPDHNPNMFILRSDPLAGMATEVKE